MKWEIESVVDDEGPTMTVRVRITKNDGSVIVDQRSMPDGSTDKVISAMCDELCVIHFDKPKKDLTHLTALKSNI